MNLAKFFVELAFRGFDKVPAMMSRAAQDVERGFAPITEMFRKSRETVLDFTRSGAPLAFNTLSESVVLLKSRIGSSFAIPIANVAKSIQDLSRWVRDLDPRMKGTIATWATLGVVAAGLAVGLGAIAKGIFDIVRSGYALITSPISLALAGLAASVSVVWAKIEMMEQRVKRISDDARRIRAGDITDEDLRKTAIGASLLDIKDPRERAAAAAKMEAEFRAKAQNNMAKLGDEQDRKRGEIGMEVLGGLAGGGVAAGGLKAKQDKVMAEAEDAMRNAAIAGAIKDAALNGKMPNVRSAKKDEDLLKTGSMGGAGLSGVGIGSGEQAYNRIQMAALGQSQIQQEILKEQRDANQQLLEQRKDVKGIWDMMKRSLGL